jgi:hypothetical protein
MDGDFDEVILGKNYSENDVKKTKRRYYVMIAIFSLALYFGNMIWHFSNKLTWWVAIIGGCALSTSLFGFYYIYRKFLLSKHKLIYAVTFILFALFKLLHYILCWKKF